MFKTLPGFREFYPEDCAKKNYIFGVWRRAARSFGFSEFEPPVLEQLDLFTEKSGEEISRSCSNLWTRAAGRFRSVPK